MHRPSTTRFAAASTSCPSPVLSLYSALSPPRRSPAQASAGLHSFGVGSAQTRPSPSPLTGSRALHTRTRAPGAAFAAAFYQPLPPSLPSSPPPSTPSAYRRGYPLRPFRDYYHDRHLRLFSTSSSSSSTPPNSELEPAMSLVTPLTTALGIRVPVIQGGMQWVGVPQLVAAVSNAGGLGILTALTQPNPDALRAAIRETRTLTSKPFGVNLTLLPSINPPDYQGYATAAVEEGVRIFETAGNNPGPLIKYFKSQGCFVIHKCTTVRHAKSAEKLGVDMLSIDGFECAGHPGEDDIGGLVLMARAVKELKVPFVASGGVADARGLAAALALGAVGANMGTRFMCTVESPIHQNIKEKIVASTERDTVHIFRTLHNTARVYKNKVAMEVVAIEKRGNAKFEDVRDLVSGARGRQVYEKGDVDAGIWSAGVAVGLIDDIPTCEELLRRLERETVEIVGRLNHVVVGAACPVSKAKL
ncbi:hypothetical protein D9619_007236 [Psilocybe cf. subviscida]|uniref:Nitronate monooxygenase domain-containing protein n=1 Tax=Psilocybe cf. subviscida TaxID=2480587 RepID=A0A8H5EWR3_9AGAR|nr:hypothetical protein D9619_007236 [Psilocybe cf. subviscida]